MIVVDKKSGVLIKEQMDRIGFELDVVPSMNPDREFIVIRTPYDLLAHTAEQMGIRVELKLGDSLKFIYKFRNQFMPFNYRQKHVIIQSLLSKEIDLKQ